MLRENLLARMLIFGPLSIKSYSDISVERCNNAVGIFYILDQLFLNSMQLVIVPMVFTSIALAMYKHL